MSKFLASQGICFLVLDVISSFQNIFFFGLVKIPLICFKNALTSKENILGTLVVNLINPWGYSQARDAWVLWCTQCVMGVLHQLEEAKFFTGTTGTSISWLQVIHSCWWKQKFQDFAKSGTDDWWIVENYWLMDDRELYWLMNDRELLADGWQRPDDWWMTEN